MGRRTIYPVHCWSWYASLSSPSPRFPDYPRRLSTRQTIQPGLQILPISSTIGICGMRFPLPSHIFTWLSTPSLRSYTTRIQAHALNTPFLEESLSSGGHWPFCDVRVRLFIFFSLAGCKSYRLYLHTAHLLEKSASMSLKDLGSSVFFSLALSIFIFAFVTWKKNQNLDGICYIESATTLIVWVDLKARVAFCQSYTGHTFYRSPSNELQEHVMFVEWYISRPARNSLNSRDCHQFNFVFIPSWKISFSHHNNFLYGIKAWGFHQGLWPFLNPLLILRY